MQRSTFEDLKPFLKIIKNSIKNRNFLDFTGSIQYFIDSIGVPKSEWGLEAELNFRLKKNEVIPSSEREAIRVTVPPAFGTPCWSLSRVTFIF